MTDKPEKEIMTLRLPVDLDAFYKEEAARLGVPKHSLIIMKLQAARDASMSEPKPA